MSKKDEPGRPTKLTPELTETLCSVIRSGGTIDEACEEAGISRRQFHDWQARGRMEEAGTFRTFFRGVSVAKGERIRGLEDVVIAAAKRGDWRAAIRLLEAYEPHRYMPRVAVHVEQELNDALERLRAALPADQYERALAAISGDAGRPTVGEVETGPLATTPDGAAAVRVDEAGIAPPDGPVPPVGRG